jgi:TonB-linked SusC/RagA family outer membrane protein
MNGGNEKTRFMISSSYLTQKGIVDNNDFNRYNLTANLNHKVNSNLTIGANVLLAKRDENPLGSYNMTPEIGKQAAVSNALVAQPFYPVYNENGNLGPFDPNSTWGRFLPYGIAFVNPLIFSRAMDRQSKSLNTLSTLFIEWKFLNDFTFKSSISAAIDYSTYDAYIYDKADYGWDQLPASRAYASYSNHLNWLTENTITFNKTIGKHSINAFVGYTAQKDEYQSGNITATGFPNDQVHTLNAATTASSFSSTASEWSLLSNIGRANYTYDSKYLLTATLRRDGSSRFGKNTKWGYFPSGSLGWRMNEEDFMKSISWIDNMKLRLSYGVTGNNLIPNYGSVGLLGQSQYAWGSTSEPGLYINSIPNPDLKWEKTGQWDLGLNVGLFANRIYMEVDYYQSVTRDMLLNVPVPSITGFTTQLTNIGQLQNNGFEFLISTKNLTGEFKWSTDFNISTNKNKVLQLGTDGAPIYSSGNYGVTKTEVGQPIANFYGYVFDGVFMTQAQTDAKNADGTYVIPRPVSATGVSLSTAGDPIIRDVNKDGKIDANDRTTIGNAQPDFTFGLTNTFQYKNFDFSFCLQGQYGNEIINSQARFSKTYNGGRNQYAAVSNYWKSEANPGDGKAFKPMLTYNALQSAFSTYWVEDGSFLRIRNVQLGYNVPKKALEWSPLASARIYVNAENLHVFTSYIGYDPENSAYSGLDLGNDYGATPMPMTITFGMKLNF